MAKIGLSQVNTTQTFQTWLDRTNDIVDILTSDAMTASALGDTTTGNATLIGSFTANNVVVSDLLRANTISPKVGSTSISITNPINVASSTQTALTLTSSSGPLTSFASGSVIWRAGFENTSNNNFMIDTGTGARKFLLSPSGDLTIAGSITTGGGGTVTANLVGNVTGNLTGNVTGNVTGTVSSLSNHTTSNLAEGSNLYFTTARARSSISASGALTYNSSTGVMSITDAGIRSKFSGGTGVTYNSSTGVISIGQAVATTSNVTFADLITTGTITSTGAISSQGDITAFASSSDIRKKENVFRIENALEKVSRVGGYTFNFKGDNRKLAGVIAQEIEAVLPEVVYEIEEENGDRTKAVRYGNIVGLLIEAIKELKAEVEDLKVR